MKFKFVVEVECERLQGKFASREELEEQIRQQLDDANPSSLTGDSGGEYDVTTWDVIEVTT